MKMRTMAKKTTHKPRKVAFTGKVPPRRKPRPRPRKSNRFRLLYTRPSVRTSCPICKEKNVEIILHEDCYQWNRREGPSRQLDCIHTTKKKGENLALCVINSGVRVTQYITYVEAVDLISTLLPAIKDAFGWDSWI